MAKSINDEKKNITDYIPYFFAGLFVISLIIYIIFLLIPKNNQIETKKLEMMAGETLDISNELDDKTDFDSLIYMVNDEKIATIDKNTGVLEAKSTGKVTVTVKSSKNPLFEKTFVVTVESSESYVKFNKNSYTCTVGSKVDITITYGGDVLSVIDYSSSDNDIATIKEGTISGKSLNCKNCRSLNVECNKTGEVVLTGVANTGISASANLKVIAKTEEKKDTPKEEKPKETTKQDNNGWIKIDKQSYTCTVGESFDVKINVGGTNKLGIQGVNSSNTDVATISSGSTQGLYVNCIDCALMHVDCKSKGTATITATSLTGVKATAKVTVKEDAGWVKISKTEMTCEEGETVDFMVTTGGTTRLGFNGITSKDTNIATVSNGFTSGVVTNCIDCMAMHVDCKKQGTTTITATNLTGAKATATVTVTPSKGWIRFSKTAYTCKVGDKVDTMVNAGGASTPSSIGALTSSNNNIASISNGFTTGIVTNCIDCRAIHINCKAKGTVTLTAKSSTGATGTATVTVRDK